MSPAVRAPPSLAAETVPTESEPAQADVLDTERGPEGEVTLPPCVPLLPFVGSKRDTGDEYLFSPVFISYFC